MNYIYLNSFLKRQHFKNFPSVSNSLNAFQKLSLHKEYVEKGTPYSLFSLAEKKRVARQEHFQMLASEPTDVPAPTPILCSSFCPPPTALLLL